MIYPMLRLDLANATDMGDDYPKFMRTHNISNTADTASNIRSISQQNVGVCSKLKCVTMVSLFVQSEIFIKSFTSFVPGHWQVHCTVRSLYNENACDFPYFLLLLLLLLLRAPHHSRQQCQALQFTLVAIFM